MFKTEVCEILGIEYPIILGGMLWVGGGRLTAAVSDAGGFGLLGAGGLTLEQMEAELEKIRKTTDKPFGVNVPLLRPDAEDMIETAVRGGASAIATATGSPAKFTKAIKDKGCRVLHIVPNVAFALKAEAAGVDVVVAEGHEAGGHNGYDEITTMALVPQVAGAVKIPVVAAGGIADGKGLAAALALGAKGVQMGTRFLMANESDAHDNIKEFILNMSDNGTIITGRTTIGPTRAAKNKLTDMIVKAENEGADSAELSEIIGEGRSFMACFNGDCENGTVYCGQIGGHIKELKSAAEIIRNTIREAAETISALSKYT